MWTTMTKKSPTCQILALARPTGRVQISLSTGLASSRLVWPRLRSAAGRRASRKTRKLKTRQLNDQRPGIRRGAGVLHDWSRIAKAYLQIVILRRSRRISVSWNAVSMTPRFFVPQNDATRGQLELFADAPQSSLLTTF